MAEIRTAIHAAIWAARPDMASLVHALDRAAAIGFDCLVVPLRRFEDVRAADLARAFEARGLTPLNTTALSPETDIGSPDAAIRRAGIARLTDAVDLARDMGSIQINGVLYAPLGKAAAPAGGETRRRSAEGLAEVAETAAKAGIRLGLEIVNRYETAIMNTVEEGLAFLDLVGHPNATLHLDTYHMSIEEADPAAALQRALPRLGYFELDQSHRGRLDEGSLDLAAYARPLAEAGYSGLVGVEAFSRSLMAEEHANALSIWRDTFTDGDALAADALRLIREVFRTAPKAATL